MSNAGFRPQEIQRRKFQQAVAQTFDAQAQAIQVTREFVADLSAKVDALSETVFQLEGALSDARVRLERDAIRRKGFLGRLRWLVTGR